MGDRLEVAFHRCLNMHSDLPREELLEVVRRGLAALDVDIRFDENAPLRCDCDECRAYRRSETEARRIREGLKLVNADICPMHRVPQPCATCEAAGVEP